jgi:hypothetical protein
MYNIFARDPFSSEIEKIIRLRLNLPDNFDISQNVFNDVVNNCNLILEVLSDDSNTFLACYILNKYINFQTVELNLVFETGYGVYSFPDAIEYYLVDICKFYKIRTILWNFSSDEIDVVEFITATMGFSECARLKNGIKKNSVVLDKIILCRQLD